MIKLCLTVWLYILRYFKPTGIYMRKILYCFLTFALRY